MLSVPERDQACAKPVAEAKVGRRMTSALANRHRGGILLHCGFGFPRRFPTISSTA